MAFTAQGMADAITAAEGVSEDAAVQADANLKLATGIVTYIESNLKFLIPSNSFTTTGSPLTHTGPTAPVILDALP